MSIIIDELLNQEGIVEMTIEVKNPLVIYHANCADGFSAAWVFHHMQDIIEQAFDFHPGIYNELPPDVTGRDVYLVDFSYKRAVVVEMSNRANSITLIDHHKTALEDLKDVWEDMNSQCKWVEYTDLERSGAMLAWDFWNNTTWDINNVITARKPGDVDYKVPPLLLNHIQDRDLWKFKLPLTREINANVFSYEYTFENWDNLMLKNSAELTHVAVGGIAIERKHHKDIKELVNVCRRFLPIGPYVVPVASLPYTMSSDAGHLMAKEYKEGTAFAACYWDTPTHRIFSLRSCDTGIDVSEVASTFGGGGHRNAAGFRVPRDHLLARS